MFIFFRNLIKKINFSYRIKHKVSFISLLLVFFSEAKSEVLETITAEKPIERTPSSFRPVPTPKKTKTMPEDEKDLSPSKPVLIIPSEASPSEGSQDFGITGNWGGLRSDLDQKGVNIAVIYKAEISRVLSGGLERENAFLQNLDLRVLIDADKLLGLKGTTFFIYGLGDWGADRGYKPTAFVGDAQGTSNIETGADSFKLYEAWVQQKFANENASVLFGVHDLNSEFYVTESSGLFLNSSFGVGRELSQTGLMGPSIFPSATTAIRIKVEPTNRLYMQSGIFNALAGDRNSPSKTHFSLSNSEGFLLINEVGINATQEQRSKFAMGYWSYTRTFDDLDVNLTDGSGNPEPRQVNSSGAYFLFDKSITETTSLFLRYGVATTGSNLIKNDLSGGIAVKGLLPSRAEDKLGLAFTRVSSRDSSKVAECAYELTYRAEVSQGLALQPDFQYITNPGFSEDISKSFVGGLRLEIGF